MTEGGRSNVGVRRRRRRQEERDSLKTEFVYVRYGAASDIFTVTEPGPLGAEIIHQGDVLAMCQTHTVWNCVYCETDIKDVGGEWRRTANEEQFFFFFWYDKRKSFPVFLILESSRTHAHALADSLERNTNVHESQRQTYDGVRRLIFEKCVDRVKYEVKFQRSLIGTHCIHFLYCDEDLSHGNRFSITRLLLLKITLQYDW